MTATMTNIDAPEYLIVTENEGLAFPILLTQNDIDCVRAGLFANTHLLRDLHHNREIPADVASQIARNQKLGARLTRMESAAIADQ